MSKIPLIKSFPGWQNSKQNSFRTHLCCSSILNSPDLGGAGGGLLARVLQVKMCVKTLLMCVCVWGGSQSYTKEEALLPLSNDSRARVSMAAFRSSLWARCVHALFTRGVVQHCLCSCSFSLLLHTIASMTLQRSLYSSRSHACTVLPASHLHFEPAGSRSGRHQDSEAPLRPGSSRLN